MPSILFSQGVKINVRKRKRNPPMNPVTAKHIIKSSNNFQSAIIVNPIALSRDRNNPSTATKIREPNIEININIGALLFRAFSQS